ncbi:MAG: hypothetical protein M0R32_09745 [Candidatus Cloacimonetes bacterium]|jgi:hypothetical protein|nr:hypothetical protein [Candidatus Cloacimonadota bacterium]
MITTLKDRDVNITWKETGTVQSVTIKSIDLMNDWVCLQSMDGDRLMFWARLEDMDVIQVVEPNYDPNSSDGVFGINGELAPNITTSFPGQANQSFAGQGTSFVKVSMEFLLPQASPEFYMATNAPNAFSAIYKIMESLEESNDDANKIGDKETANRLAKIRENAHNILLEFGVDFEEGKEGGKI